LNALKFITLLIAFAYSFASEAQCTFYTITIEGNDANETSWQLFNSSGSIVASGGGSGCPAGTLPIDIVVDGGTFSDEVFDLSGKKVTYYLLNGANQQKMDISNLSSGIYFVDVTGPISREQSKLIIQR